MSHRIIPHSVSSREDVFRDGIRARNNKCVISGRVHRNPHIWTSFETAHVFPLEKESLWIQFNYGRWITNMDNNNGGSKINSLQNGILLQSNIHRLFDFGESGCEFFPEIRYLRCSVKGQLQDR